MVTTLLVVGTSEHVRGAVAELDEALTPHVRVHTFPDADALADWTGPGRDSTDAVVLVLILPGAEQHIDDLVQGIYRHPSCPDPRVLLVTDRSQLDDLGRSLDRRLVHGVVSVPWTDGTLATYARAQIWRWIRQHPDGQEPVPERLEVGSDLLRHLEVPLEEAARALLDAVDETLGPRPRIHLPAGVRITDEGLDIDQIFVVVSGRVSLTVRTPLAGTVTLNHASTGPVIGLLALADRKRSMVTARTTTAVEMVQITVEQLDRALAQDPRVGAALTALTIRALTARLRRAQIRRVEKTELSVQLRQALAELEQARADLVAQARMATVGELAAGIAHELNNPVAAVTRSADHLAQDLPRLLGEDAAVSEVLARVRSRGRPDTREERAARRELSRVVTDPVLVRRLVTAGVTDPELARRLTRRRRAKDLERVELAAGVGSALHSLELASQHIASLVEGLRRHVRPDLPEDGGPVPVDVAETVDDALHLLGHRLRGVQVEVDVEPGLPPVASRPGQLAQVWTNLVTNAVDAMGGTGSLRLTVAGADRARVGDAQAREVVVTVVDDGPGIPEEMQEQIFEPRFTTKHGVVRFGLGLGLSISRTIVDSHHGTIELESRPGRTCFRVTLPGMKEET